MKNILIFLLLAPAFIGAQSDTLKFKDFAKFKFVKIATDSVILKVHFDGIFMGECGKPGHCTHEPVAGFVEGHIDDSTLGDIPNTANNIWYWSSGSYSLVCYNLPDSGDDYRGNGDRLGDNTPDIQGNIQRDFYYYISREKLKAGAYKLRLNFNLGNTHKDNDFATTGHHWLKPGADTYVTDLTEVHRHYTAGNLWIGPYETESDRCHVYWLRFKLSLQ